MLLVLRKDGWLLSNGKNFAVFPIEFIVSFTKPVYELLIKCTANLLTVIAL